jgi:hypothetical protein
MANANAARQNFIDAWDGKIDADQFAANALRIESQGIIAQVTVALELDLEPSNDMRATQLVLNFRSGKIDKSQLSNEMLELSKNSILQDTGQKAVDHYKELYNNIQKAKNSGNKP